MHPCGFEPPTQGGKGATRAKARKFLEAEMEKFFFGAGSQAPQGYQPPEH
jgi:Fe-S cluster biosynthesis and repair protein YggX